MPWISTGAMREVDRVMIEDLGIDLPRMMEGAGRCLAQVVERVYSPERVVVLAGPGGNGGGGLVAARHLLNHGVSVSVVLTRSADQFADVPRYQLTILERMGVDVLEEPPVDPGIVIDAMIGYSLRGAPRGRSGELIEAVGEAGWTVVSLDVPSGLDTASGATPGAVVSASSTVTLAAPKVGLGSAHRHPCVGRLFVADISVPPSVYVPLVGHEPAMFAAGPIVEVTP